MAVLQSCLSSTAFIDRHLIIGREAMSYRAYGTSRTSSRYCRCSMEGGGQVSKSGRGPLNFLADVGVLKGRPRPEGKATHEASQLKVVTTRATPSTRAVFVFEQRVSIQKHLCVRLQHFPWGARKVAGELIRLVLGSCWCKKTFRKL